MFNLQDKLKKLPDSPGVYLFKGDQDAIIYIGKAKSLKKRVVSYFGRPQTDKNQAMVSKIADLDYILTNTHAQAQILEASLVKEKQPRYNIDLKDDKSFPFIKISNEKFPLLFISRRRRAKSENTLIYFGPYTNQKLLRQAIKMVRRIFGFRSCKNMPKVACLYYRLKLCPAPCIGKISSLEYAGIIKHIILFLGGKYEELIKELSAKMLEAAKKNDFETAAKIRDQLNALAIMSQNRPYSSGLDELEDLKNLLKLKSLPERIEAFDISNISGKQATGSMVSFYKGQPDKNNYRRFRIKTVIGIDDYKMLAEVVRRRYLRLKTENLSLPDLILIDGGKAHLLTANNEIKKLGLAVPLVSIAKDKENLYLEDKKFPIRLRSDTLALNLIRRIRDEAHRFAIKYHHLLRRKKMYESFCQKSL